MSSSVGISCTDATVQIFRNSCMSSAILLAAAVVANILLIALESAFIFRKPISLGSIIFYITPLHQYDRRILPA